MIVCKTQHEITNASQKENVTLTRCFKLCNNFSSTSAFPKAGDVANHCEVGSSLLAVYLC